MSQDSKKRGVKERGNISEDIRRRRADELVCLRKSRKNDALMKKRNISNNFNDLDDQDDINIPVDVQMIERCFLEWQSEIPEHGLGSARMAQHILKNTLYNIQIVTRIACCVPLLRRLANILQLEQAKDESRRDAARIFGTIISGPSENIINLEQVGAIDSLIFALNSTHGPTVKYSVSALGNYMGDNLERKFRLIGKGVIPLLIGLLKLYKNDQAVMSVLAWTLVNLCGESKSNVQGLDYSQSIYESLALLSYLILTEDDEILTNTLTALGSLTGENCYLETNGVDKVIQSGICARLVQLLEYQNPTVAANALSVIGNILYHGEEQAQIMINLGVIAPLVRVLQSDNDKVIREALWSLANVSAGTQEQLTEVANSGAIVEAVRILKTSLPVHTKKEAVWILTHISRASNDEIIKHMNQQGVLQALCFALSTVERDPSTMKVALRGLRRMLRRGEQIGDEEVEAYKLTIESFGGKGMIEDLSYHENDDVNYYAGSICDEYLSEESDDD